jgi:non-ribosomal peptide synthase protein (TIGR01720 family)
MIKSVKEQLRRIPNKGIGYGLLRYLGPRDAVREQLQRFLAPEISFNYLGQFDQTFPPEAPFLPAGEAIGKSNDPSTPLPYALDINVSLLDARLVVAWGFSGRRYKRQTILELGEAYLAMLTTYIRHCVAQEIGRYTPSDFPDIDIDQGTLDHIFEEIG